MIRISKNIKDEYKNGKIQDLFSEVDSVLQKRQDIHLMRMCRKPVICDLQKVS